MFHNSTRCSFNDDGKRTNFSFDVVEMSPGSDLVNIGTWSDKYGLVINPRNPYSVPANKGGGKKGGGPKGRKTYVLSTVLEEPFLMPRRHSAGAVYQPGESGNDDYEGYVKDLAQLIAKEIGVSFEIKPTRDGRYGSVDSSQKGTYYFSTIGLFHPLR